MGRQSTRQSIRITAKPRFFAGVWTGIDRLSQVCKPTLCRTGGVEDWALCHVTQNAHIPPHLLSPQPNPKAHTPGTVLAQPWQASASWANTQVIDKINTFQIEAKQYDSLTQITD